MLLAGSRFLHAPVMGLQTGGELARTSKPVIDPKTLEILAYEVEGPLLAEHPSLLRVADVREFSDIGLIIDSSDEFVSPDDIIKLKEIYQTGFDPLGMPVIDKKKRKLGKVNGYTIDTTGFVIQQLSVKRPLLKSFTDTELLVHRSQIIEINDQAIVVRSETKSAPKPVMHAVRPAAYDNPFRKKHAQTEHVQRKNS